MQGEAEPQGLCLGMGYMCSPGVSTFLFSFPDQQDAPRNQDPTSGTSSQVLGYVAELPTSGSGWGGPETLLLIKDHKHCRGPP